MNKLPLYLILICSIFSFTSCENFLEVEPTNALTEEVLFSNENDMYSYLQGVYARMLEQSAYAQRMAFTMNPNTDVEIVGYTTSAVSVNGGDLECYDAKPYYSILNDVWNAMYKIINTANDFIEGMERSDLYKNVSKTQPSNLTQMYAEAKVLRAVVYLDLIRIWGDVIFRTTAAHIDDEVRQPTTDRYVIMDYLIDELKGLEPTMYYASDLDYGVERASREFCQGLIGLLAMNRGGWTLRPDTGNPANIGYMDRDDNWRDYYGVAIEYLGKVINEGRHSLSTSYEQFWKDQCNWKTAVDDDVIFGIPMRKHSSSEFGYYVGVPIEEGTHSYGSASGRLGFCGTYIFSFDNDDLRRDITCYPYKWVDERNQGYANNLKQEINMSVTSCPTGKWNKLWMDEPLGSTSQGSTGFNYNWMRYADVLLLYAEAVNEIYGPREDAKEALMTVRRRAFDSSQHGDKVVAYVNSLGSREEFFKAIMNERKWEFGGESIRKYDLARWNKFGEVIYDLYHEMINWGQVANGNTIPGIADAPRYMFWRLESDGTIDLEGLETYHRTTPAGYTRINYAIDWWRLDQSDPDNPFMAPADAIRWSFRGFINYANASSVSRTDPLRYLAPYPSQVITDHRGAIKNYYGY